MELNKYYAQFGEDKILNQIFNKNEGVCVEVGGFDGITGSNTLFFERLGWRCLIVEPMPEFCKKIRDIRLVILLKLLQATRMVRLSSLWHLVWKHFQLLKRMMNILLALRV